MASKRAFLNTPPKRMHEGRSLGIDEMCHMQSFKSYLLPIPTKESELKKSKIIFLIAVFLLLTLEEPNLYIFFFRITYDLCYGFKKNAYAIPHNPTNIFLQVLSLVELYTEYRYKTPFYLQVKMIQKLGKGYYMKLLG